MHRSLIEAGAGRRTAHLTGPCQDRNISNGLGRQGHTGRARSCHGPPALVGSTPTQTSRRWDRRCLAGQARETCTSGRVVIPRALRPRQSLRRVSRCTRCKHYITEVLSVTEKRSQPTLTAAVFNGPSKLDLLPVR